MLDTELRGIIDDVKDGRLDRRAFVCRMISLGLTAPMASQTSRSWWRGYRPEPFAI